MNTDDYTLIAQEIERAHPGCRVYFDEDIDTLKIEYLIEINGRAIRYRFDPWQFATVLDVYNKLEEMIRDDKGTMPNSGASNC